MPLSNLQRVRSAARRPATSGKTFAALAVAVALAATVMVPARADSVPETAAANTIIAPGSKVTLPDAGVTFTAPPSLTLSDARGSSVIWFAPQQSISLNQPTALEFVNDPKLADCKAWEAAWQQRLDAPGSPEKQAGLMLMQQRGPYIDERWSEWIVTNPMQHVLVGDYGRARWEFCLPRPGGGVLLARTAGSERNVALMMAGPSAEIATALYGRPAQHSVAVESVPRPASELQTEQKCAALKKPETLDEIIDYAANCQTTLEARRADALACQYGYWLSCGQLGRKAQDEGDLATAAALLQRACDLSDFKDICKLAAEAKQAARAAKKR